MALGVAAIGSFIGGTVATVIVAALAVPLTKFALLFRPADYFSLMVFGLMVAVVLARGSLPKAIAMILVGILLSMIGLDLETGEERLTFGWMDIADGIEVAVIGMGVFGFAEILRNLEAPETRQVVQKNRSAAFCRRRPTCGNRFCPSCAAQAWAPCSGLLPGNGAVLAPFATYALEKKSAGRSVPFRQRRHRRRSGT